MISPTPRRVVITGMGLVCPLGSSKEEVWQALSAGRTGIGPLEMFLNKHVPTGCGAEARQFTGHIDDFGPLDKTRKRTIRKSLKVMCRENQMGVAAAQLAMHDAHLAPGDYDPERTGVLYGADYMMTLPGEFIEGVGACLDERGRFRFARWAEEGMPKVEPLWILKYLPNMSACHIAIFNQLYGPNNSITIREASPNLAVGEAYCTITRGSADILITGGVGTRLHPVRTLHIVLEEQLAGGDDPAVLARPFDLDRTGMVVGEGAGAMILESLETAQARGAPILAEVIGYGNSAATARNTVGQGRVAIKNAIDRALATAGFRPEDVGHLHAHGLGTRQSDIDEARAINEVFGDRAEPLPVVAAKSYFGNLGAGGGMVELITSILAIQRGRLFRTLNHETPDPQCPISVVTTDDVPAGASVLNVNATPQGQAGAVLVRRFE